MMFDWTVLLVALVPLVGVLWSLWRNNTKEKLPPSKKGWIPWLGVAVQFGKAPLSYIKETQSELGDVFTIYAAGKRMTFLFDYNDSALYFKSMSASFQDAAVDFTTATANIAPQSFYQYHSKIHDIFKGQLTSHHLSPMCCSLSLSFHQQLLKQEEGKTDLMQFVRNTMFPPVVRQLFGDNNLQLSEADIKEMQNKFVKYDADFEYAQLPAIFNQEWCSTKEWLLNVLQEATTRILQQTEPPQHVAEHIAKAVDPSNATGYSLMVLWASQANAIPISFWTLAFILSHPPVLATIRKELEEWSLFDKDGQFLEVTESHLKLAPPTIKRAILEAIRLRSPGMIPRKVMEPMQVKGYTIPAGHYLMLSPYHTHRNTAYFPNPEQFDPDRWLACDLDKNQFLPGFVAFGGGRYQCPGRWFALMELHLYISIVLKMVDMTLLDPVPKPSLLHLTGSQQPQEPCHVEIRQLTN